MLADLGHASPTEHASFTFGIEGISRACSHQLVRHRIASYSQQSQRYVDGSNFEFVTPPAIAENEEALEAYNVVIDMQAKAYKKIRNALTAGYIKEYLNNNVDGSDEEIMEKFKSENKSQYNAFVKKANEDARFILPNATTTKIVCTFNARSLQNFLLIVVATEHSGRFARLPNKCFCSALRLHRTCLKTAVRPAFSALVPREKCAVANKKKCVKNTADNRSLYEKQTYSN